MSHCQQQSIDSARLKLTFQCTPKNNLPWGLSMLAVSLLQSIALGWALRGGELLGPNCALICSINTNPPASA